MVLNDRQKELDQLLEKSKMLFPYGLNGFVFVYAHEHEIIRNKLFGFLCKHYYKTCRCEFAKWEGNYPAIVFWGNDDNYVDIMTVILFRKEKSIKDWEP